MTSAHTIDTPSLTSTTHIISRVASTEDVHYSGCFVYDMLAAMYLVPTYSPGISSSSLQLCARRSVRSVRRFWLYESPVIIDIIVFKAATYLAHLWFLRQYAHQINLLAYHVVHSVANILVICTVIQKLGTPLYFCNNFLNVDRFEWILHHYIR